jgi:hypothetical protein
MAEVLNESALRIVSGPVAQVEAELNTLLNDYMAIVWNFAVIKDEQHVTAVLLHGRELRKQQLAQGMVTNQRR